MVDLRPDIPPQRYFWLDYPLSTIPGYITENHLLLGTHISGHEACQAYLEKLVIQNLSNHTIQAAPAACCARHCSHNLGRVASSSRVR